ncbi:STAS domain-containing protein [Colwelliaceae bacterium MEBiC 14330]
MTNYQEINALIEQYKSDVINNWVDEVILNINSPRATEEQDCQQLLELINQCLIEAPNQTFSSTAFKQLEQALRSFSAFRALNDYTPTQTANYLLLLKKVIYELLFEKYPETSARLLIDFNNFIDKVAVLSFQYYSESREEVVSSQAYALEHDTPIVKISKDILLMPLMGIIDTVKAQKIIEGLLESIVENQATMAILDMTAVPTFDTHVANNILKTIVAAKMVGTQVILSGISTNAALTIVKLGVDLSHVETFNTLENAIAYGYNKTHTKITQE